MEKKFELIEKKTKTQVLTESAEKNDALKDVSGLRDSFAKKELPKFNAFAATGENVVFKEEKTETKKEQNFFATTAIEKPNYDFIKGSEEKENKDSNNKKNPKFRFRLIIAAYSIIIGICGAWVISNAVNISKMNSEISELNYKISEAKYIYQLKQLDNVNPDPEGSGLSPIENIFELQPEALDYPTSIEPKTNWFNNFCNWLSRLIGL